MNDTEKKRELIESFFNGEMDPAAIDKLEKQCRKDPELQLLLDERSGMEALLLERKSERSSFGRFDATVDGILYAEKSRNGFRRSSFWLRTYAIAATILVVLTGGILLRENIVKYRMKQTRKMSERIPESVVIPQTGKSIARIADNALMVSEEGTRVRVLEAGDSSATIIVAQGNVCLDVKGAVSGSYTVVTPHMALTLDGTAVRMVVTELETEINVLEGNVVVMHRYDTRKKRALEAGHIVFADHRSLKAETRLAPEVCLSRLSMLRAYMRWIQEQKNG